MKKLKHGTKSWKIMKRNKTRTLKDWHTQKYYQYMCLNGKTLETDFHFPFLYFKNFNEYILFDYESIILHREDNSD